MCRRRKGIYMLKRCFFNFKFKLVLFVFFLPAFLITTSLGLQAKTAAVEQTAKSCLWSIQARSNKVYLLGSVHFLRQDAYPLAAAINRAYTDSRVIMFETGLVLRSR